VAESDRTPPTVYLLYGDDSLAISEFITRLREKLGDPGTADLNTERLVASQMDLGRLAEICAATPFLARRRLVIVDGVAHAGLEGPRAQAFFELLESLPPSTALALLQVLEPQEAKSGDPPSKLQPLIEWVSRHPNSAYVRLFRTPSGPAFADWLRQRCARMGGEIEPRAVQLLAEWVGEDARVADQELAKLLDYVDRQRPVRAADVEQLTPFRGQSDVFAMVDALGRREAKQAFTRLRRLLELESPGYAFAMIRRQFRMLLIAREAIDQGLNPRQVLHAPAFVVAKVASQAQNFTLPDLERIYHDLLDLDIASKTGRADLTVGIETLAASLVA